MALNDYRECMSRGLKGKTGLSKEGRQMLFCTESRLCSGKASTHEEAEELCRQPKPPKVVKVKRQEVSEVKITPPVVKPDTNISPMQDWLAGNQEGECRACLLPPVIRWYRDELEQKHPELVKDVDSAVHSGDPSLIAWTFDSIKAKVSDNLKGRLKEFDYHVQNYKGD